MTLKTLSETASFAQGLTLNFANNAGGGIQFNGAGDSFSFNNGTNGSQWSVTSESGGSSSVGLNGSFGLTTFHYGSIVSLFGGTLQTAQVTGPVANLTINDGSGLLTGTVDFLDVTTLYKSVGVFNAGLQINLTNVVYSGSNPDLQALYNNQPATLDLSFQFSPGMSLTDLSTGTGPYDTSYSGSLSILSTTTVPEPSTIAIFAVGGVSLYLVRHKRRQENPNNKEQKTVHYEDL